jgi:hypothetical protein
MAKKTTKPAVIKAKSTGKKPKKVEIKTKETNASVDVFIKKLKDEQQRKDSVAIIEIMKKASGYEPKMWGSAIVGFGNKVYTSPATGRQVDWMVIGFAPRKSNISLYFTMDIKKQASALNKLGKHKTGVGCLYINKLEDVDVKVLKGMIETALKKN